MKTFKFIISLSIFIAIVGLIFAIFWDVPAPTKQTEHTVELNVKPLTPAPNASTSSIETMQVQ